MARFVDPLLEVARHAAPGGLLDGALQIGGDNLAPTVALQIEVDRAPEGVLAEREAQQVEDERAFFIDVPVEQLAAVLAVDVVDDGAASTLVRLEIELEVAAEVGARLIYALVVLHPHLFHEGGEALVEPDMPPVAAGQQVAEPLMRQLVRHHVVGRVVEAGALVGHQAVTVRRRAGVLHRAEEQRGDVVRAAPEPELPLAVLPEHLVLVLALQRPVVPAVEPPGPAHRDPVAVRGGQGEVGGADRAMLQGRVHEGGQHAVLGEHRSGPGRLGFPVGGQVGVLPAGEDAGRVPLALPVPQQDQAHRLGHHVSSAARPGRVLPWMNSRLAPPPVETWPNASPAKPSARMAAPVSPPPTTVNALPSAMAWATARVPAAYGASSNTPMGPFQKTVPAVPIAAGEPRRRLRADVQAHLIGRDGVRGHHPTRRVGRDPGGHDEIGRQLDLPRRRLLEVARGRVDLARFEQGGAGLEAAGGEEREGHGPADEDPVGPGDQAAERVELVRDLGAAEHHHIRPLDLGGQLAQRGDLGLDQVADGADAAQRHVVDAGVLAVHRAEPVRDVQVDGSRELVGEVSAGHVVLAGLGLVEAQVFQHDQAAGAASPRSRRGPAGPTMLPGKSHLLAEQFAEPGRDRRQRVPEVRPAAGTAEVRADDNPGTAADQRGQRRQAGPDPAVVRDPVAVQRHVEVRAHQDAPALDRDIIDRLHHHAISSSRRPAGRFPRARGTSLVSAQARWSGSFGAVEGGPSP